MRRLSVIALLTAATAAVAAEPAPPSADPSTTSAAPSPPSTSPPITSADLIAQQANTAPLRGVDTGFDPWTTDAPVVLFSRPTVGQAFRVSTAAVKNGYEFNVAGAPLQLMRLPPWYLAGLEANAGYNTDTKRGTAGFKWNLSWRDLRSMSRDTLVRAAAEFSTPLPDCVRKYQEQHPGSTAEEQLKACSPAEQEQTARIEKAVADLQAGRPSFAVGANVFHSFDTGHTPKRTAALSFDYPLDKAKIPVPWSPSVVLSAEYLYDDEVKVGETVGRREEWKSGVTALVRPGYPELGLELGLTGNFVSCLIRCGSDSSLAEYGVTGALALTSLGVKDVTLAGSVLWRGSSASLKDAIGAATLSYSFGKKEKSGE